MKRLMGSGYRRTLAVALSGPALAEDGALCANAATDAGLQDLRRCREGRRGGRGRDLRHQSRGRRVAACSPSSRELFPKIKTNYIRLQAGALYAKVFAERQAKTYLVDAMQISDMGMMLDFQKKGGYVHYVSPRDGGLQAGIQKQARRLLDLGRDRPGRHRL